MRERNKKSSANSSQQKLSIRAGLPLENKPGDPTSLQDVLFAAAATFPKQGIIYLNETSGEIFQSYPELLHDALTICHGLKALGLKPLDMVIFQFNRNEDFIPAFWGCILGGFVPAPVATALDYSQLNADVAKLVNAWKLLKEPCILTTELLQDAIFQVPIVMDLHSFKVATIENLRKHEPEQHWHHSNQDDLALLLLTSGSTGVPKAVMQTHDALISRSKGTIALNKHSAVDISFNWMPLDHVGGIVMFHLRDVYTGCMQVHTPTEYILTDSLRWLDCIEKYKATITWAPNFAFGLINDREPDINQRTWDLSTMRFILNGGEAIVPKTARKFLKILKQHKLKMNTMFPAWGMSETCSGVVYSNHFSLENTSDDDSFVDIGGPVPGFAMRIVDSNGTIVPEGTNGALQVKGPSVTKGYFNNPDITRESYTADGWFIVGDLGFIKNGNLTITGREKDVVIINGINYYSHEIETIVEEMKDVEVSFTAACAVREENNDTDKLAIFFNPKVTADNKLAELMREIRKRVLKRIGINPDYIIPVEQNMIPKTAIGKIQRTILANRFKEHTYAEILAKISQLDVSGDAVAEYIEPRNDLEKQLAGIWSDILRVAKVGITDNFFELGGHSLTATQVVSRIRSALQCELAFKDLFLNPTIEGLTAIINSEKDRSGSFEFQPINIIARENELELSYAQQRLWLIEQLEPGTSTYNIPLAINMSGKLNIEVLRKTISHIIARHETLRTRFVSHVGRPKQVIYAPFEFQLAVKEVKEHEVKEITDKEAATPFNLAEGFPYRIQLLKIQQDAYVLLIVMHHIITDGWSVSVLVDEITKLYTAFLNNEENPLPELAVQYVDYAYWQKEWLRGDVLQEQMDYWRMKLTDAPLLELPTDYPRPQVQTYNGAHRNYEISKDLAAEIRKLASAEGATMFMLLISIFMVLLYRYTGQEDFCVGTPVANRTRVELEPLIGVLLNTLVLRATIAGGMTFVEFLNRVKAETLGAYPHQDIPFEQLVGELVHERDLSHAPLFQVMFVLQNIAVGDLSLPGLETSSMFADNRASKFDLTIDFTERAEGLGCTIEYNTDLFKESTIDCLMEHYIMLAHSIISQPSCAIGTLEMLGAAEKNKLLVDWNQNALPYQKETCIHQAIEKQVESRFAEDAIMYEETVVTYGELNQKANRLAHYLRSRGVGAETLVGVCVNRSHTMIIALLAILKSGGAYVPLDPNYPQDRINYILQDARAKILITENAVQGRLQAENVEMILLDAIEHQLADYPDTNLSAVAQSDNLSHVIYTSGSTGLPKGVAIEHRNVAALTAWAKTVFTSEEMAGLLASTSICFDLSVYEIFVTLSLGGTIIVVENVLELLSSPLRNKVTLINTVPSAIAALLRQNGIPQSVITVNLAGEFLKPDLVDQLYERPHIKRVYDLYGPSEDTTYSTYGLRKKNAPATIGRPIANTQAYILDANLQPVHEGAVGEIYLSGDGISRGYLGKDELTKERYIENPFIPGTRMYKTGDLGRYYPDGSIEYLGRIDFQVKIRGFRIELGEIETALVNFEHISEAVVIACDDSAGNKMLVAYVVNSGNDYEIKELKNHLKVKLPDYMVPDEFIVLDGMPLTPNGKVDRKKLPAPQKKQHAITRTGKFIAPSNAVEEKIASTWQALLHIETVGTDDNFFEIGGNSLLTIELHARLTEILDKRFSVIDLFKYPRVNSFAEFIIKIDKGEGKVPVSSAGTTTKVNAEKRDRAGNRDIAIIGMDGKFPGSRNIEEFWSHICEGRELISFFTAEEMIAAGAARELADNPHYVKAWGTIEDIDLFDAQFFGYTPREAALMDPQQRLFLECAWQAMEDAGYNSEYVAGRVGVFTGSASSSYFINNILTNKNIISGTSFHELLISNDPAFTATRISYQLDLHGPSVNVSTACSTALVAVHSACMSLLGFESDMALAGGIAIQVPQNKGYEYIEGGILSPDGRCRAFDEKANGTIGGNGFAIVVLKRLDDARSDGDHIYAVIKGSAINNDGAMKVGYTAPSVNGQTEVISAAHAVAGINPETITYVETHGTGTSLGDPIEIEALTQAFRAYTDKKQFCAITSAKANVGHLDTAAGIVGLIKTALALNNRKLPPSINFSKPNPKIDFANSPFFVNTELSEWKTTGFPLRAGVSSFGIGGTNCHMVLEEAPRPEPGVRSSREYQLLAVSAKTEKSLLNAIENYALFLEDTDADFADLAYTTLIGRKAFSQRAVVVAKDSAEAGRLLRDRGHAPFLIGKTLEKKPAVVFMFPGQGSQYVHMARGLYASERAFKGYVDTCANLLLKILDLDIRNIIFPTSNEDEMQDKLKETWLTQPALFVIEYALAKTLMDWGIKPAAMIGHSIGEYVAACIAGVLTLEDALSLVAARGRLLWESPQGSMLSVPLAENEIKKFIKEPLGIAAVNGPALVVVSGPDESIAELEKVLRDRDIQAGRLHTSHAFHSSMMDGILEPFLHEISKISLHAPEIPFVSNLTGTWITDDEAEDPAYWQQHIRNAVRFADGVDALCDINGSIFLEIGPGSTLSTFVRQNFKAKGRLALSTVRHPKENDSDVKFLLATLGRLWLAGVAIDWQQFYANEQRKRLKMPTYPFARERYWIEPGMANALTLSLNESKNSNLQQWLYEPSWQRKRLLDKANQQPVSNKTCLVFMQENDFCTALVSLLQKKGCQVIQVYASPEFNMPDANRFHINPQNYADYESLCAAVFNYDAQLETIIHLWSLQDLDHMRHGIESFDDSLDVGFISLIYLARAVGNIPVKHTIELSVISNNVYEVTGNEHIIPEHAPLVGPCRVIPQEYPMIHCRHIDIDLAGDDYNKNSNHLVAELLSRITEPVVAFRQHYRWVQKYEHVRVDKGNELLLKDHGVYLITGGTGNIGLLFAEKIAALVKAKIVLIGRTQFPEKAKWHERHGNNEKVNAVIQRAAAIEKTGSEVLLLAADVADRGQMGDAVKQVEKVYGKIDGVIHAAGIVDLKGFNPIQTLTEKEWQTQFAAKVHGLYTLEKVLENRQLDFCMLTSSLATILGGLGYTAYAAANAFMDSFVYKKNKTSLFPWTSINWDGWHFSDAEQKAASAELDSLLKLAIRPEEGQAILAMIFQGDVFSQVLVSTSDLQARLLKWVMPGPEKHMGQNEPQDGPAHSRPDLATMYKAPENELERTLVSVWEDLLGIKGIGTLDSFFDLGGHSLLGLQLVRRIKENHKVEITIQTLFDASTIMELAKVLVAMLGSDQEQDVAEDDMPVEILDRAKPYFELSFAQQRMWYIDQLDKGSALFNMPLAYHVNGGLDIEILRLAFEEIVKRHESLRTRFELIDAKAMQVIQDPYPWPEIIVHDLNVIPENRRIDEAIVIAIKQARAGFDLGACPLFRTEVLKMNAKEHVLLLTMHHIISDGWSLGVLIHELLHCYDAIKNKQPLELERLEIQYIDFAHWQKNWLHSVKGKEQIEYWKNKLKGLPPVLQLPQDRPRPSVMTYKGNTIPCYVPQPLCDKLYALCRKKNVTLFMVLMAAFTILLSKLSGQDDIAVGSGVASRPRDEFEKMIGFFADVWVLRAKPSANQSFVDVLEQVRKNTLEAYSKQAVPFDEIVNAIRPERDASYSPIYQVMLILHNVPLNTTQVGDLTIGTLDRESELYKKGFTLNLSKHDLSINLWQENAGISGLVEYYSEIFEQDTVEEWLRNYNTLLNDIVENPGKKVKDLVLWTEAERTSIIASAKSSQDEIDIEKLSNDDVDDLLRKMLNQ